MAGPVPIRRMDRYAAPGVSMLASKRSLAATLCLSLAACGGKHGETSPDGGSGSYALTLIGSANLQLHPGEKRSLQVVLAQDQVGPVANAAVHFEFQDGDPAGASLEGGYDLTTDANGIATAHFAAGSLANSRPTFKLVASAPSYNAAPVAFSLNVIPVRRLLQIIGAPGTKVTDGQDATVSMYIASSSALKVRELDQDTGAPIAGDTLNFTLPPIAHTAWSGSTTRTTTAVTATGGEAQVFLVSTALAEPAFLVVGQSAEGGAAVNFNVTVQAYSTAACGPSQQCKAGQVCVDGHCTDGGGGTSCGSGTDNPCPFGYKCIGGTCQPPPPAGCDPSAPGSCGSAQCCDGASNQCKDICPPCAATQHCVAGATCGTGSCQDNPPPTPDVSGVWTTRHIFSIRDALPGAVRTIFDALRYLDQALLGKLAITGIGWIDALINKILGPILSNYIPAWVQTLIHLGDDLGVILSNLRSEGSMRITNGADIAHIKGTEVWTSLVFYWLPLCGDNIGGDVDVPPACARIDLATTDSSNPSDNGQCKGQSLPSITVQALPFTGTVTGAASPYVLNIDQRRVSLKMGKVLLVLVDSIIALTTPYRCIDEATDCQKGQPCIIDCPQLGADIARVTNGIIDAGTGEQICDTVVTTLGQTITGLLANAWPVDADVLDFKGHAKIHAVINPDSSPCANPSSTVACADKLGNDTFERDLNKNPGARDGWWEGDFFFKLIGHLPGAFEAQRPAQ